LFVATLMRNGLLVTGAAKAVGAAGLRFPMMKAAAPKKLRASAER
jgi:hypothetical protein